MNRGGFVFPRGVVVKFCREITDQSKLQTIEIPLDAGDIQLGGNEVNLTNLEGSWLVFDNLRLVGPEDAVVREEHAGAYLRNIEPADYQLDEDSQPLLIDLEHLEGTPQLEVLLDSEVIMEKEIEQGRYVLEAAMPAVRAKTESNYLVKLDGRTVAEGVVIREPQPLIMSRTISIREWELHIRVG